MPGSAPRIFLSYRRADARHLAGRLADRICARFGLENLFMDIDSIEAGADFRGAIVAAVSSSDVLLALIGPNWVDVADSFGRRRIDDLNDVVVLELRTALDRGIVVIPVLVDGARMPSQDELPASIAALAGRNAVRLDHESFTADNEKLLRAIERSQQFSGAPSATHSTSGRASPASRSNEKPAHDDMPEPQHSLGVRIGLGVSFPAVIAASYTVGASVLTPGGKMSFAEGAPFAAIFGIVSVCALVLTFTQVAKQRQRARIAAQSGVMSVSSPSLTTIYVWLVVAALLPALLGSLDG